VASSVVFNPGSEIRGNGSLIGGTILNIGGNLAIASGNITVQKFSQSQNGSLTVSFTSSGQSLTCADFRAFYFVLSVS